MADRFLQFLFDMETADLRTLLATNSDVSMIALSRLYVSNDNEEDINRFVRGEMRAGNLGRTQLTTLLLWKDNYFVAGGFYDDDAAPEEYSQGCQAR
jgi:hypothetical protein